MVARVEEVMTVDEHLPVLVDRVVELLADPRPGLVVDATVGVGGHAAALLAASGPEAVLVGLDRDPEALALAAERLGDERVHLVRRAFDEIAEVVEPLRRRHGPVRAVLYDLGVSSLQLDRAERGFAFAHDGPLDMRMDPEDDGPTAADLVNELSTGELARLLREGGEDRHDRRVAAAIVAARPLRGTAELARVVHDAVPAPVRGRTHPATRTFQALRLAVNRELERFAVSLPQALDLLAPPPGERGGRVAVLAYHSGEDRLAKRLLGEAATGCVCPPRLPVCGCGRSPAARLLTRGAERPDDDEIAANPRARSARLRAAERLPDPVPDADLPSP